MKTIITIQLFLILIPFSAWGDWESIAPLAQFFPKTYSIEIQGKGFLEHSLQLYKMPRVGFSKKLPFYVWCQQIEELSSCGMVDLQSKQLIGRMSPTKGNEDHFYRRFDQMFDVQKASTWIYGKEVRFVLSRKNLEGGRQNFQVFLEHKVSKVRVQAYFREAFIEDTEMIRFGDLSLSPYHMTLAIGFINNLSYYDSFILDFVSLEQKLSQLYNVLGMTHYRTKKWEKALKAFQKATAIYPSHSVAAYNAASAAALLKKRDLLYRYLRHDLSFHGDQTRQKLKKDPDFRFFRGEEAFQNLLTGQHP